MPDQIIYAPFVKKVPTTEIPITQDPLDGHIVNYNPQGKITFTPVSSFRKNIMSGIKGEATPSSSPTAWSSGDPELFEKWDVKTAGTYTNFKDNSTPTPQSIVITADDLKDNFVQIWVTNGVSQKALSAKPDVASIIETWTAQSYVGLVQVAYNNKVYELPLGQTAASTDVPGTSTKWVEKIGGGSESVKVTFNSVIKFDKSRKYSVINQAGDINITYDPSGTVKDSMIKHLIISDGSGDISFSSDFEVIGLSDVDKTKNQQILYSRPEVVEFKVPAIIMNVAKSGQTSPIDLEPDALAYVNRIIAAGGAVSNGNQLAINNYYLSAKANGYFSKLKSLFLAIGSTTNSRLVNGVTGAPAGVLSSGTITNDGIVGVIDSALKPSDIFTLDNFSYGYHNTTPEHLNTSSMGCATGSTSGITFSPAVVGGLLYISGPNRDVYGSVANADSLGAYVVSRTGSALAKCFKNGTLILTHTAGQGAATLPNINFAIGGNNDSGIFSDDGRTSKWAFLAEGLTDTEASSITSDLQTLMTAIGR